MECNFHAGRVDWISHVMRVQWSVPSAPIPLLLTAVMRKPNENHHHQMTTKTNLPTIVSVVASFLVLGVAVLPLQATLQSPTTSTAATTTATAAKTQPNPPTPQAVNYETPGFFAMTPSGLTEAYNILYWTCPKFTTALHGFHGFHGFHVRFVTSILAKSLSTLFAVVGPFWSHCDFSFSWNSFFFLVSVLAG